MQNNILQDEDYIQAEKHMYYFYNTINQMEEFIRAYNGDASGEKVLDDISSTIKDDFIKAMDDDFNTSSAIANLHIIFKYVNNLLKSANKANRNIVANTLASILANLKEAYGVLGLFEQNPVNFINEMKDKYLKKINMDTKFIEEEIAKRAQAKKNKDYETADKIRNELENNGIILNDTTNGTIWDIKALY